MATPFRKYLINARGLPIDYWFYELGFVAGYFSQLEQASYVIVDRLGVAADSKLLYVARTKRAGQLMEAHLNGDLLATEWADFIAEAVAVADMRNKILHNPLTVHLVPKKGEPQMAFAEMGWDEGIKLMTEPGQPLLSLGDVQAFADRLRELNKQMLDLFQRTTF